jgi:hypothetical protein
MKARCAARPAFTHGGVELGKGPKAGAVWDVGEDRDGGAVTGSWIWPGMRGGGIVVTGTRDMVFRYLARGASGVKQ